MGSSKQVVEEHNEHNLEAENSVESTMKMPRTGGQQANPMIDVGEPKENKCQNWRKCKRSYISFAELLDKYQKKSEEKNAYRPNMQRNQDHPQGGNMRTGIGKVIILMQHIHILIFGRQCQCRGCPPMFI